ncbi:Obg family GTPase CgtA [Candidatus Kaiserbacteria bacterium RIFCSPHIGHO2_01_FULL_50_13]|uniref:Obg family GTPase CgtA n=1 Tax=Candidatus Kaiserbacteria bacterium RIFCSPLOWO2_01_FULL_50_24 TaxID=1798507 RepID=A0A1F6EME5_9BACT|nr:MAG: Obg family GTPase CgtA [Candidatus Kaiserbacteria bacterium RIFCSPHIGHO2_01_FULL_50_13]OGG74793.1 MAG: Obg family GTPase CgtA [Candidatus Kaiserbacteria bacterium RIFCSPLOWO2_01_FULL_50_24]OGG81376.1 MAG: Obg family GTPase CgtA [Candidatus Kaiserbacteria bacterium RIFCSPLOWO2_02_FULL_51_13]
MLIDEVLVTLHAGHGGRGAVAFNKVKLSLGPTGGDGGRGASIYFEGVADINMLKLYASRREIRAKNGGNGRGQFIDGKDGAALVLKVPTGTSVVNMETGYTRELTRVGERILVAGGGDGGRGNFKFRSGSNTSPKEFEEGKDGDVISYRLLLRLIADVGLVGLPNAGKSSLLNELTAAAAQVGDYPFTTLEPNLGAYYGLIIADIPGLIEGASDGKGLGVKFLKHIERTKTLFHLIATDSDNVLRDYEVIREELLKFNPKLAKKSECVFLSKCDTVTPEELKAKLAALKRKKIIATPISILDDDSLDVVKKILNEISKTAPSINAEERRGI